MIVLGDVWICEFESIKWLISSHCIHSDYQGKINACKQRTTEAQSEAAAEAEIDKLQKELEQEIQREQLLREELR